MSRRNGQGIRIDAQGNNQWERVQLDPSVIGQDADLFARGDNPAEAGQMPPNQGKGYWSDYDDSYGSKPERVRGGHGKLRMAIIAGGLLLFAALDNASGFIEGDLFQRNVDSWAEANVPGFRYLEQNSNTVNVGKIGASKDIEVSVVKGSSDTTTETTWIQGVLAGHTITAPNSKKSEEVVLKAGVSFDIKQDAITLSQTQGGNLIIYIDPSKDGGKAISSHIVDPSTTDIAGSTDELRSIFEGIGNTSGQNTTAMVNKINGAADAALEEANVKRYGTAKDIGAAADIQIRNQFTLTEQQLRKMGDTAQADQIRDMLNKKSYVVFANWNKNPNMQVVDTGTKVGDQTVDTSAPLPSAPVPGMTDASQKATVQIPGPTKVKYNKEDEQAEQAMISEAHFQLASSNELPS